MRAHNDSRLNVVFLGERWFFSALFWTLTEKIQHSALTSRRTGEETNEPPKASSMRASTHRAFNMGTTAPPVGNTRRCKRVQRKASESRRPRVHMHAFTFARHLHCPRLDGLPVCRCGVSPKKAHGSTAPGRLTALVDSAPAITAETQRTGHLGRSIRARVSRCGWRSRVRRNPRAWPHPRVLPLSL